MNKKSFVKRILAVALSIIMVLGLMPMSVLASDTFPGKPDGMTVTGSAIETINGQKVWLCPNSGGGIEKTTSENDYAIYEAVPYGGYSFSHWATYCVADDWWNTFESANRYDEEEGYVFSKSDSKTTRYNEKDSQIRVNTSNEANYTYYVYAVFVQGVSVSISVEGGGANISAKNLDNYNSSAGEYEHYAKNAEGTVHFGVGKNSEIQVQIISDWAIYYEHVYVNGVDIINDTSHVYYMEFSTGRKHYYVQTFTVTEPITIRAVTKQRGVNVIFYSNDVNATGTMEERFLQINEDYNIPENQFVNEGYIFSGWNTKADGTGIAYTDKQSVRFTIADDGIELGLYAQWTKCNNHTWTNGECTKCGAVCSHSGGNATCTEQATCSECGMQYGEFAKHNMVYSASQYRIVETCMICNNHFATADLVCDENVSTIYTGSAIEGLKVDYSDNWQGGQLGIDYSNNINVGTASGSISIDGVTASQSFDITMATMSDVSAQGYSGIYDGQAHGITVNAPAGATVSYKAGDGAYSSENPTFKDAGTYMVSYKVSMANYADVEGAAEVKIDRVSLTVTADNKSKTYGDADSTLTYSITSGALVNGDQLIDIRVSRENGENAGTYAITASQAESANKNYEITFKDGTFTINTKTVTATVIVNGAPFTYNTQEQKPEVVVKDGDTVIAASEYEVSYSDNINAGTSTVTITDKAGGNYVVSGTTAFTIEKATPVVGTVGVNGVVKDTMKPFEVVLTRADLTVDGRLELDMANDDAMLANKSDYNWVFTPIDTANYNVIKGTVQIDVQDTVAPVISISLDNHRWTLWDTITFGLFYNDSKEVTIAYADNESGSGLKDMLYFVANEEMSLVELQDVQWTAYTEAFDIDPDGKYVVYAKAVDNDGNILIINSDGVVVDETAAVVSGITDGETYYGQLVFTVVDELAGVKSVVIDSNDVTHFEGQYVIDGDNAEHTVAVTDNAENVTEYKVTVYKNYTVTYKADGEVVDTVTVGHSKDATLPAVPHKVGYVGKWDSDGKNITADTVINAVYIEIDNVVPDELKIDDKTELEDIKKQLEDMLKDDSYTEDDKKAIQESIDAIEDALETISNVEEDAKAALNELNKPVTDPNSPATGDDSNLFLWIELLFISGGTLLALTVYNKKKRTYFR